MWTPGDTNHALATSKKEDCDHLRKTRPITNTDDVFKPSILSFLESTVHIVLD